MASLLGEIKRRKVFQVAAVYAVVAWLLVQIITSVKEPLNLPDWADSLVIVLLAIGFPVAVILAWAFDITPEGIRSTSDAATAGGSAPPGGQRVNYVLHTLVLFAVGFLVVDQYLSDASVDPTKQIALPASQASIRVRRLAVSLVSTGTVGNTPLSAHLAISPNGDRLVYAADVDGEIMLYQRRLDQFDTQPIPGTDFAQHPAFSPDGQSVVFVSDDGDQKLTTVNLATGRLQPLTDVEGAGGVSWGPDGQIIFATPVTGGRALFLIAATGGKSERIEVEDLSAWPMWPHYLPGGDSVLITLRPPGGNSADGSIAVLSLDTRRYRVLIEDGYNARYSPSGHIVFARDDSLYVATLDLAHMEVGPAVPYIDNVQVDAAIGGVAYALAADGTLVYIPRQGLAGSGRQLVFRDRNGTEETVVGTPRQFERPRLSPDGRRVAVDVTENGNQDIYTYDVASGRQLNRLTIDPAADSHALWMPGGRQIYFYSNRRGGGGPYFKSADGSGSTELLTFSGAYQANGIVPEAFTPDGEYLIYRASNISTANLGLIAMAGQRTSRTLLNTPDYRSFVAMSPDGKWIAYASNEGGGRREIFIRRFPDVERDVYPISNGRGTEPVWPSPGNRLFYREQNQIMVVELQTEPVPRVLDKREFASFSPRYHRATSGRNFDVQAGGERVLLIKLPEPGTEPTGATQLAVVENWARELEDMLPSLE